MDVLCVPRAVTQCHEGVFIVYGLAVAVAASRIGLDQRRFFFLRVKRSSENALALGHVRFFVGFIVVSSCFRSPGEPQHLELSFPDSYFISFLQF
jgi:hypothetical protein